MHSFVPARTAKIGLIDRIVTRIKTVESTGKGESCFMIDLKQVKSICETATERSLILIDEFGKGKRKERNGKKGENNINENNLNIII